MPNGMAAGFLHAFIRNNVTRKLNHVYFLGFWQQ